MNRTFRSARDAVGRVGRRPERRATARPARLLAATAAVTISLAMLTGCGAALDEIFSGGEPPRDEPGGEITASAEADAFEILKGDCIDLGALAGYDDHGEGEKYEVESVPVVPCAEPHTGEVYAELVMEGDKFPGEKGMAKTFEDWCYAEFEKFVGISYDESVYGYTGFYPTKDTWKLLDDRTLQCIVSSEEPVKGTLKDAAQ
ncbi:septum formation family protein [Promicromonospora vindobonensis]|uniref:Septum formation family protein n=1 Tax=Promicromonospora vindobonensis TaxID=195748 RepID=A0ABW5VUI2_9MICO